MMPDLLEQFRSYLLTQKRASDNTVQAYVSDINQFIISRNATDRTLQDITIDDLKKYLSYLKAQSMQARTMSRKISALKLFYAYAHEQCALPNLAEQLHFPKIEKQLPKYLNEEEVEQLLRVADHDRSKQGIRNKTMLYLLYVTGMRISELTVIKIEDIRFDTNFLMVRGKGGKERQVPLPGAMVSMLRFYLDQVHKEQNSQFLFPSTHGTRNRPMTRQAWWGIVKQLWSKTGSTKNISPHQLRHSLATHLLKKGADLRSLQLLLGHEQVSTVQIYTHVETDYLRTIYDKKHPRS